MSSVENPMAEPRAAASLTGSLLARRGGARPAMRRQPILLSMSAAPVAHDDLGWNDMGEEGSLPAAPIAPVTAAEPAPPSLPPINAHIAALAERMKAPSAKKPVRARPASLAGAGRRAAFTLRIEPERHLRLRLLTTLTGRSAQRLLTEALDAMIAGNDQLQGLADKIEAQQIAPVQIKRGY